MIRSHRDGQAYTAVAEAALVARLADGDRDAALSELQRRYGGPLYGLGTRLLGDHGMAEELVQDTFVRLWRSAGRYDPAQSSVRTFLYTLARRAAIDLRRRAASRPLATGSDEDTAIMESVSATSGPDAFDDAALAFDVRDAMNSLSPKHREVLELHYDHDLTQRQIAERLECPLGTVKTRTYHGLLALREELEGRGLIA